MSTRSISQVRTKRTFTWRFFTNRSITCGFTVLRKDSASTPLIPSTVYCEVVPCNAVLILRIVGFFWAGVLYKWFNFVMNASTFSSFFSSLGTWRSIHLTNLLNLDLLQLAASLTTDLALLATDLTLSAIFRTVDVGTSIG